MANSVTARAPQGAAGGIYRRQRGEAPRGKEWIRPYKRAQRALDSSASMILWIIRVVEQAGMCAAKPVQSMRKLIVALRQATAASLRLEEAKKYLAEAAEAIRNAPPELLSEDAEALLALANERCETVQHYIYVAAQEILLGEAEIYNGVASGEVVPEDPSEIPPENAPRRRRIIARAPRIHFVRAFLAARRKRRVGDRITPILLRRRRIPRPAETRVPRRHLRGRAPPLAASCLL